MPAPRTDWTVEMLQELPDDGKRYEVIDGLLLVTPAPSLLRQRTVLRLGALLLSYASSAGLDVLVTPEEISWQPRADAKPLTIDVTGFFRAVHGEVVPTQ